MALSEEDKARIREEELYRLEIREEFRILRRHARPEDRVNPLVFLIIFAIAFGGMWMFVKSVKEHRNLAPAAMIRVIPETGSAARA